MNLKEDTIEKLQDVLITEIEHIKEKKYISEKDRASVIDILFDTYKFLNNYDENVKILNKTRNEIER